MGSHPPDEHTGHLQIMELHPVRGPAEWATPSVPSIHPTIHRRNFSAIPSARWAIHTHTCAIPRSTSTRNSPAHHQPESYPSLSRLCSDRGPTSALADSSPYDASKREKTEDRAKSRLARQVKRNRPVSACGSERPAPACGRRGTWREEMLAKVQAFSIAWSSHAQP